MLIVTACKAVRRGYTLVELLVVLALFAIVASLALFSFQVERKMKLRVAARVFAADVELAQALALGQGVGECSVFFRSDGSGYWIATDLDPYTPLSDVRTGKPLARRFGEAPLRDLNAVQVASVRQGGVAVNAIAFGSLGELKEPADAAVTLSCDGSSVVITLDHVSAQPAPSEIAP